MASQSSPSWLKNISVPYRRGAKVLYQDAMRARDNLLGKYEAKDRYRSLGNLVRC